MQNYLPLKNYKFIELAGIGPAPFAGKILTELGAKIVRIEQKNALHLSEENEGKTVIELDLKTKLGREKILSLLPDFDGIFEGTRPGVMERLKLGPKDCLQINPKLIYGRITGWGQTGPWAGMAGHDINYIGLSGALHAMGDPDYPPCPPLNLVGDYGAGSQFLVIELLAALLDAKQTGIGRVLDIAIIDGVYSMMGIARSLEKIGLWQEKRGQNLLDGSRPYYRCYKTSDDTFMAIGCIEPKFFALMLKKLEIDPKIFGEQNDPQKWPNQIKILQNIFSSKPRIHWEELFDNIDACVTPVLSYKEANAHKQMMARQ